MKSNRPTGEEIRQAKKFLLNKNIQVQIIKPNLFAQASKELQKNFNETLTALKERISNAQTNGSNIRGNKKT
jgi:hypothetical protein